MRICKVEGCGPTERMHKGYCPKHYQRQKNTGTTERSTAKELEHHGEANTKIYNVWSTMKRRCLSPKVPGYAWYGGRGIKVCDRWINSYVAFRDDMGPRPEGTSLDRIDSDGDYTPENCKWSTHREQANNKRTTVRYEGKVRYQWVAELGVTQVAMDCSVVRKGGLGNAVEFYRERARIAALTAQQKGEQ